jgi:hypothetical protein
MAYLTGGEGQREPQADSGRVCWSHGGSTRHRAYVDTPPCETAYLTGVHGHGHGGAIMQSCNHAIMQSCRWNVLPMHGRNFTHGVTLTMCATVHPHSQIRQ